MTTQPPEREGASEPNGPQSPAGPQSPNSPQSPAGAGGPQSPAGSQSPGAPPQSPAGSPQSPGSSPQAPPPAGAPQAPAPGSSPPPPGGPQSAGAPAPNAPQSPGSPQSPGAPQSPASPAYSGPVPPGGWQQPVARAGGLPANVALASWGSRVGATLLDALLLTLVGLVLLAPGIVLSIVNNGGAIGPILIVLGVLVWIVLGLLYAAFFMQRDGPRNGQTLGKQALSIRAVRMDGQPFSWGASLLRELAIKQLLFGFIGGFFLSIPTILDYLWPLWDDENRALHDMVASTRVVRA